MSECKTDDNSCDSKSTNSDICCPVAQDILCAAKTAKRELLIEKVKIALEAKIGQKMDNVADVAADAIIACCEGELAKKEACGEYQSNLLAALKS